MNRCTSRFGSAYGSLIHRGPPPILPARLVAMRGGEGGRDMAFHAFERVTGHPLHPDYYRLAPVSAPAQEPHAGFVRGQDDPRAGFRVR